MTSILRQAGQKFNANGPRAVEESGHPIAQVETITPEVATRMIESSDDFRNRRINNTKVSEYARAMEEGRWTLSPDAISFDPHGRLINGQHRLWAIIESGVTIQGLVVRGLPTETFQNMDRL